MLRATPDFLRKAPNKLTCGIPTGRRWHGGNLVPRFFSVE
jgi:hypothetical protein